MPSCGFCAAGNCLRAIISPPRTADLPAETAKPLTIPSRSRAQVILYAETANLMRQPRALTTWALRLRWNRNMHGTTLTRERGEGKSWVGHLIPFPENQVIRIKLCKVPRTYCDIANWHLSKVSFTTRAHERHRLYEFSSTTPRA